LAHVAPETIGTMLLLSDGTVMAQSGNFPANTNRWYKLTPDASGSYVNGTWSQLATMHLQRLYYGSAVLPDGRVFVVGGEYSGPSGGNNDTNTSEIYDPVTNSWSNTANFPRTAFGDDPVMVLPDGRVLGGYLSGPQTYIYNPTTDNWTATGTKLRLDQTDEESWVKLPDDSIVSYDVWSSISSGVGHAQRYFPATGQWVDAGTVPSLLSDSGSAGYELGPGFLLPDGRAWFTGANGNTAFYDPSSNSWAAGPDLPVFAGRQLSAYDDPGAVLPNGNLLLAVGRLPVYGTPTSILEFDPGANTYTDVTPASGIIGTSGAAFNDRMLVLPTGQVLVTTGAGTRLAVYTPDGSFDPSVQPTISSVTDNGDGSFTLTGTQLNGINEGAAYGDDAQMSSNYPIVQITDSSGQVLYARTYHWSSTSVATGSTPETTQFTLPAGIVGGYSVSVIANGIASAPFVQQLSGVVFNDVNADGTRDPGDPGLAGWTVFIDLYGDGQLDPGDPVAVADASGGYSFSGLAPGTYTVYEVVPAAWAQSAPAAVGYTVNVTDSTTTTTLLDFGNVALPPGSIQGTVFNDLNADATRDPGDPGLAGWTVFLDLHGDGQLHDDDPQTVTDVLGRYVLSGLSPGTYSVFEVVQDGWSQTGPPAAFYGVTIDDNTPAVSGLDFGNMQQAAPAPRGGRTGLPDFGSDPFVRSRGVAPMPGAVAASGSVPGAAASQGGVDWPQLAHRAPDAHSESWILADTGRPARCLDDLFASPREMDAWRL
jgi:hypothetical protein